MVERWDRRWGLGELSFGLGLSLALHTAVAGLVLAFPHFWGGRPIQVPIVYEVSLIGPPPGSIQATSTEVPLVPPRASSPMKVLPTSKGPSAPPRVGEALTLPERRAVRSAPPRGSEEPALSPRAMEGKAKAQPLPEVREGHDLGMGPPARVELPPLPPLPRGPVRVESPPTSTPQAALAPKGAVPPFPAPPATKGPAQAGLASGTSPSASPSAVEGAGLGFQGERVEVEGDPHLAYYLALVKYKIESIWEDLPTLGLGPVGPVIVSLRILRNGQVKDIAIEASSGNKLFDDMAIRALRLALPLPPFPSLFREESVPVKFRFTREVVKG